MSDNKKINTKYHSTGTNQKSTSANGPKLNAQKNANYQANRSQKVNMQNYKSNSKTETKIETKTETKKLDDFKNRDAQVESKSANQNSSNSKVQEKSSSPSLKNDNKTNSAKNKKGLIAFIIIGSTLLVGGLAAVLGGRMRDGLVKPPAYPPNWVFPVVWTLLYIAIGIAATLSYIWVKDKNKRNGDMICYGVHLFFNLFWTLFYFRLDLLVFSTVWLLLMIITAIITTYRFARSNLASGIIFVIYTAWLIYAMYLSLGITLLNVPINA